jgi:hypothetical protein
MAIPATRAQFIDYCKRNNGWPVIDINVDDDQVEDRVDEALEFYQDYHYDGSEKTYLKHRITQQDRDRKYILIPNRIIGVTAVMPFDDSAASVNMFDLRYQLRLHDLYDFTSVSYVPYTITMQHLRTMQILFSGTPQFRFHRHRNRLNLDIDWEAVAQLGSYVVMECYATMNPDRIDFEGTVNTTAGSNTITSTGATLDSAFFRGDEIVIANTAGDIATTVDFLANATTMNVLTTMVSTETGLSVYQVGNTDVWNDRWLKKYGSALIKKQFGTNLKKFGNVQMPGGIVLNGQIIFDEAIREIKELEEEMFKLNILPNDFYIG